MRRSMTPLEWGLYLQSGSDPAGQRITLARFAASRNRSLLWGGLTTVDSKPADRPVSTGGGS